MTPTPRQPARATGLAQDAGVKRLLKAGADYLTVLVEERRAEAQAREEAREAALEAVASVPEQEPPPFRDRAAFIAQCDLGPGSLVGSYFLATEDGEAIMMGLIVAEPQPPAQPDSNYLVQVYDGILEKKTKQLLIPVTRMLGKAADSEAKDRMGLGHETQVEWSFYDTKDQLEEAWLEYCTMKAREPI